MRYDSDSTDGMIPILQTDVQALTTVDYIVFFVVFL